MAKRKRRTRRTRGKRTVDSKPRKRIKRRVGRPSSKAQSALLQERKLREAVRLLRKNNGDLDASARGVGMRPATLARQLTKNRIARKVGNHWDLYRRGHRSIRLYADGQVLQVTVSLKTASIIGRHLSAVGQFVKKTNDPEHLKPFVGRSVKDLAGKEHTFETRPNVLYRLYAGTEPLEELYRILI
jgi:predicted DNA-binding protein (UPF0251 family)